MSRKSKSGRALGSSVALIAIGSVALALGGQSSGNRATGQEQTNSSNSRSTGRGKERVAAPDKPSSEKGQVDLSGSYTGVLNRPESGLTGEATLTIKGDQFTLTSGSNVFTGHIEDLTESGPRTILLRFESATAAYGGQATTPPTSISLRLGKSGERLTFESASGEEKAAPAKPAKAKRTQRRRGRDNTNQQQRTETNSGSSAPNSRDQKR